MIDRIDKARESMLAALEELLLAELHSSVGVPWSENSYGKAIQKIEHALAALDPIE